MAPSKRPMSFGYLAPESQPEQISDKLIAFVSKNVRVDGPPRKRQKMSLERKMGNEVPEELETPEEVLEFIVVKEATWEIECPRPRLSDLVVRRQNIKPRVVCSGWGSTRSKDGSIPRHIEIEDEKGENLRTLIIPENREGIAGLQDVYTALRVHVNGGDWAKGQGKISVEFEISLFQRNRSDYIGFHTTIKWNATKTPYDIAQFSRKPRSISIILETYFADSKIGLSEWSPQDFYQSVHTSSEENDDGWESLETNEVEATLYPFQKRAVKWCLRREGAGSSQDYKLSDLPISFRRTKDDRDRPCYISHLFGLVTLDIIPFQAAERALNGGILADEMGLGKTISAISLITLHKRPAEPSTVFDAWTGETVRPTAATLIITPPSISEQWIELINKHAPQLKVMHYQGVKSYGKMSSTQLLQSLAGSDIVISTYAVLAAELHYTQLNPEKSLRRTSKYPRPKSPLMQLSWWRVCMDEAQMIESGVSNAAIVARLIPRINAWCITGTPVRKDVNDLLGLLVFLRYEPYASTKHVWKSLISSHKQDFRRLFNTLAIRHSKRGIRDELRLPAQRRYVITMPFTPIEEQHYQELFNQMCEEVGVNTEGGPLSDDWEFDTVVAEKMRKWLVRLRQAALHPEVGGRNRRALGHKDGPLRTVDEVLSVMMENTDMSIRTDQRAMLVSKLKRGQLFENSPRVREALHIWQEVVQEAGSIVGECREQLRFETEGTNSSTDVGVKESSSSTGVDSGDGELEETESSSHLGALRMRLRAALEVEHMAVFLCASAHFQIKTNHKNNETTIPDSQEYLALEKLEVEGYATAKRLRREILTEIITKAEKLMSKLQHRAQMQQFIQIPEFPSNLPKGGLESRKSAEQFEALTTVLNHQANTLDEWREKTIQFLIQPLVDEDDDMEITGEEYEDSTKTQDEVIVYVQALRAAIADRHDALTGQENQLILHEIKTALRYAKVGDGPSPPLTLDLLKLREQLKPTKEMGSIRGIVAELRALAQNLRLDAEKGNGRAQNELSIVEKQLSVTQKQLAEQTKANSALEKEIDLFTSVMNTRLEFYRQLQALSDAVIPYEGPNSERVVIKMLEDEEKLAHKIASAQSKRRYLEHLQTEAANPEEQRICVICRETFEVGALTVCGHQYCKECIGLWWHSHKSCPVCKKKLTQADLHDVTYKPQELSIQAEEANLSTQEKESKSRKSAIYSEFSKNKLMEINQIELDGSFTSKVNTLARHLIWLRETEPGAKSIIYSQFKDFLDVLAVAFRRFRIGHTSFDKPNGITAFKNDPGVECFLLHARAHSSGLNLVNANHVFLCEPLLNTALELQAIARVDRIGQHQETNVWLYLVDGTVETSIYEMSVKRRMDHIGQAKENAKSKGKAQTSDELLDTTLEEANSLELQQAPLALLLAKGGKAGEMVQNEDLWNCLFGGANHRKSNRAIADQELRLDQVRRRFGPDAINESSESVYLN